MAKLLSPEKLKSIRQMLHGDVELFHDLLDHIDALTGHLAQATYERDDLDVSWDKIASKLQQELAEVTRERDLLAEEKSSWKDSEREGWLKAKEYLQRLSFASAQNALLSGALHRLSKNYVPGWFKHYGVDIEALLQSGDTALA